MSALGNIAARAAEKELPFLVAGGHAVIAHAYAGITFDLALVIQRSDRSAWKELAIEFFFQFKPANPDAFRLDLMMVNDTTFAKILLAAVPAPPGEPNTQTVSLRHLLALKWHSIKSGHEGRVGKDAHDVMHLVKVNRLDMNDPDLRAMFLEFGTNEFHEKADESATAASGELTAAELPDWSGMRDHPAYGSADAVYKLCEEYLSAHPAAVRYARELARHKCEVEFVL